MNGLSVPVQAVPYSQADRLRRLRTRFNQTMTGTGRLAMDELNLQCMPNPRAFHVPMTQVCASWCTHSCQAAPQVLCGVMRRLLLRYICNTASAV